VRAPNGSVSFHSVLAFITTPSSKAAVRTEVRDPTWNNKLLRYNNEGERERQSHTQQVTQLSTCLSDIVSISRPICSTGTASGSKLLTTSYAYISCHGKAPPVDSFMAEDVKMTGY